MANNKTGFGWSNLGSWFGNSKPIPKGSAYKEIGVSGVSVIGGYARDGERSSRLIGQEKYRTFANILTNTSIVAAGARYFLNIIAKPSWSCEAADASAEAEQMAEFVEEVLDDLHTPWSRIIRRCGTYRFYGFAVQEWTAKKRDDGKIGFHDIESRPQWTINRWEVDERGTVTGCWQRNPLTGEELGLPRSKIMYLVDDTLTDSPEGMGLFRHLVDPADRLTEYLRQESFGFMRDLRGIPIARAPMDELAEAVRQGLITNSDKDNAIREIAEFAKLEAKDKNTALTLSSQPYISQTESGNMITGNMKWGVELVSGAAPGLADIGVAIMRLNQDMARILGVEHLLLGADSAGSFALAKEKSSALYLLANSVLQDIRLQVQHDLIDPLWALNGFDEKLKPTLKTEDVSPKDVQLISQVLRDMATAGSVIPPDDEIQNWLRDLLGAPHLDLQRMAQQAEEQKQQEMDFQQQSLDQAQQQVDAKTQQLNGAGKPNGKFPSKKSKGDVKKAFDEGDLEKVWTDEARAASLAVRRGASVGRAKAVAATHAFINSDTGQAVINKVATKEGLTSLGKTGLVFALSTMIAHGSQMHGSFIENLDTAVEHLVHHFADVAELTKLQAKHTLQHTTSVLIDVRKLVLRKDENEDEVLTALFVVQSMLENWNPEVAKGSEEDHSDGAPFVERLYGLVKVGGEFDEDKHPRAKDGKFTDSGGGKEDGKRYPTYIGDDGKVYTPPAYAPDLKPPVGWKGKVVEPGGQTYSASIGAGGKLWGPEGPKSEPTKSETNKPESRGPFSEAQHAAIQTYMGDDIYANAFTVNGKLRSGEALSESEQKTVQGVIEAINSSEPTSRDLVMYRGASNDHYKGSRTDPGFTSLSADRDIAKQFSEQLKDNGFLYEVTIPKGTRLLDVDKFRQGSEGFDRHFQFQKEFIGQRGATFERIGRVRKEGDLNIVKLRMKAGIAKTLSEDQGRDSLSEVGVSPSPTDKRASGLPSPNMSLSTDYFRYSWDERVAKDFDEDKHPRDEHGRWTDGVGITGQPLTGNLQNYHPAPTDNAHDLFKQTYDHSVTANQVIDAVPGAREALAQAQHLAATDPLGKDTKQLHTIDHSTNPVVVGQYTPAREALHKEIMQKYFTPESVANARPAPGEQPTFTILGGRGGSGKSWFTGKETGPGQFAGNPDSPADARRAIVINSDDIKGMLPEYKGWNSSAVHLESSDIAVGIHEMASKLGVNVIWDGTLKWADGVDQLVNVYEPKGYKLEGHYMHAAPQVAAVRAMGRFLSNGRLVSADYVLGSVTNEKNFDGLRSRLKRWSVYDSNSGGKPRHVASGANV